MNIKFLSLMKPQLGIIAILLSAILWIMPTGCGGSKTGHSDTDSLLLRLNDTIVVGTLYSPTSYFLYKGDLMGYHYDLANRFAKDKGVMVKFKVTRNMESLLCMLDSGDIDIIAYNVPITAEFKEGLNIVVRKSSLIKCLYNLSTIMLL